MTQRLENVFKEQGVSDSSPAELIKRAATGNATAWAEIVRRYERLIWSTTRNFGLSEHDAVDVAQTVWLRFAQSLEAIRDPDRVGLWLHTTSRNECMKFVNQKARTVPINSVFFDDLPCGNRVEDRSETFERDRSVRAAFRRLPEKCQSLLQMLISDPPLSYQDISDCTGLAVGSIGSRRQRCLQTLKTLLSSDDVSVG